MRTHRRERITVAGLLLLLLTAFAVSPPECFYHSQQTSRVRKNRAAGPADSDREPSFEAGVAGTQGFNSVRGDSGDSLPAAVLTALPPGYAGLLLDAIAPACPSTFHQAAVRGRAPPVVL